MSLLSPLLGAAASGLLQRTYLMETDTDNGIPRILIVFDVIEEETPTFSSQVTEHPVEEGTEVSDHIQPHNPTLNIKGTISSTPLDLTQSITNLAAGGLSAITSGQFRTNILNTGLQQAGGVIGATLMGNSSNPLSDGLAGAVDSIARSALLDAYDRKARFDVITKRQRYESMVIEEMSFPMDSETGKQLHFDLTLKKIRVVSPFEVNLSSVAEGAITGAVGKSKLGQQASKGVKAATSGNVNRSLLKSGVLGITNFLKG